MFVLEDFFMPFFIFQCHNIENLKNLQNFKIFFCEFFDLLKSLHTFFKNLLKFSQSIPKLMNQKVASHIQFQKREKK